VRNVTFEEGLLHRSQIQAADEDPIEDANFSRQAPGTEENPVDFGDIDGDPPIDDVDEDPPIDNAENASDSAYANVDPPILPPPNIPMAPAGIPPIPIACPRHIPKPTEAVLRSQMYLQKEAEVRRAGEDWARNNCLPRASLACLEEGEELIFPVAFASILKGGHDH
jgi:hypothetical protein